MAHVTIKSRKHGHVHFWMPDKGGYVRLEGKNTPGSLGKQICYGGRFRGNTVTATPETFESEVRKWWRAFVTDDRELF